MIKNGDFPVNVNSMYDIKSNIHQACAKGWILGIFCIFTWETISYINGSLQSYFILSVNLETLCFTWM